MDTPLNVKKIKYFNEKQIDISAVLGGPIPPGIMFYKNFKALNRPKDAYFSLLVTGIFSLLLVFIIFSIPDKIYEKIPSFVFTAFYAVITAILYRTFLKEEIDNIPDENRIRASNWTVAGFTLLGLILFMLTIFLIAALQPPFKGESVQIGETNNEIYYEGNVTEENMQTLTSALEYLGYFSYETANAVLIERMDDKYIVTIPTARSFWNDTEIISSVKSLKDLLTKTYDSDVVIILEDYNLTGKRLTKKF